MPHGAPEALLRNEEELFFAEAQKLPEGMKLPVRDG